MLSFCLLVLSDVEKEPPSLGRGHRVEEIMIAHIKLIDSRKDSNSKSIQGPCSSSAVKLFQLSFAFATPVCKNLSFNSGLIDEYTEYVRIRNLSRGLNECVRNSGGKKQTSRARRTV